MSTGEHIVRHKAHSHKHMPAFLQLVIFMSLQFNQAIIIINPTF